MKFPFLLLALSVPAFAAPAVPGPKALSRGSSTVAVEWPQWRGPNRDGNSTETGLLKQWPAEGPKRAWLYENAGLGYSSFSIVAGRLFTIGTRDENEILLALDAKTGKELWATPIGEILGNNWGDGPRGTPTVDADRVYAISGKGNLVCAQAASGKIVWEKSMQDLGGKVPGWGYTESPLVDGKLVVATPGGDKGTMAAFDKMTGALAWQSADITEGAQYSSIVPATLNGKKQYVQLVMQTLFGVDPANGKLIWRSPWSGKTAVIPTPIVKGDEVFISSGYGVGCKKVKVNGSEATDVFMNKDLENHHGGVILIGDYLYGHSNRDGWTCMNFADGTVKWQEKKALGKGAIAYADGMLYCQDERSGTVALIEASPNGWSEKSRFTLSPLATIRSAKGAVWTHPVIVNGKLYLRDQNYIYCHDVRKVAP
jgi:outer membrane protein assembly factor BamB